jgi:hypothetical protein
MGNYSGARSRCVAILTLVCAAAGVLSGVATASSATAASRAAAARQCAVTTGPSSKDAADAAGIMRGTARVGKYGTMKLAANPTWKSQSTLDRSGNANMHSLAFALPLLREGVKRGDARMTDRFYYLLADWRRDLGPQRLSYTGPYSALPEGQRIITLACAIAGPRGGERWLSDFMREQARHMSRPDHWVPANNVNLHQSMGVYIAGHVLGDATMKRLGAARMGQIGKLLILPDGSDKEGATGYAKANYDWFGDAVERLRLGGTAVPAGIRGYERIPPLLAAATRPDGTLEMLGDTVSTITPVIAGTVAEYAATAGRSGPVPEKLFSSFAGGYVFDRSGWGRGKRAFADETFWSMRTGGASVLAAHSHRDVSGLTLAAYGRQLLHDAGQYSYSVSAARTYVTSRQAHNVVSVAGLPYTATTKVRVTARRSSKTGDWVTVTDPGYKGAVLTRTVYYDRAGDYLVVWDSLRPSAGKALPSSLVAAQNWHLGPDKGVSASNAANRATSTGTGANVSLRWVGANPTVSVAKGRKKPSYLGWNSQAYGEIRASPTVSATMRARGASWLTVVFPRRSGVTDSVLTATGTVKDATAVVSIGAPGIKHTVRLTRAGVTR